MFKWCLALGEGLVGTDASSQECLNGSWLGLYAWPGQKGGCTATALVSICCTIRKKLQLTTFHQVSQQVLTTGNVFLFLEFPVPSSKYLTFRDGATVNCLGPCSYQREEPDCPVIQRPHPEECHPFEKSVVWFATGCRVSGTVGQWPHPSSTPLGRIRVSSFDPSWTYQGF